MKHYVYELLPYTGKTFAYNKSIGIGAYVLEYFIKSHKKNTHFTFDNYFGTINRIETYCKSNINSPLSIFTNKVREYYLCKYSEQGRPKRTSIMCSNCEVFFCKECFTSFYEDF